METYKSFNKKQKRIILFSIFIAIVSIVIAILYDNSLMDEEVVSLTRPQSYENPQNIDFGLEIKGQDSDENLSYVGQIEAKKLSENEIDDYLDAALKLTEENMFREGENKERVITGINIPSGLPQNPVNISFSTDESGVLLENGDINFEQVKEKKIISVKLLASYREREREKYINIVVFPKVLSESERLKLAVKEKIDSLLAEGDDEIIELPDEVDGHKIRAFFPKEEITGSIAFFSAMLIIGLFVVFNEKNKKEIKKREEELKNGYTEFVSRFVILLGAGLSISAVWKRLESGFASNKSLSEEIRLTLWETSNGKTEREAYENFGKRIGGTQYAKFISVINQSLKLGSGQLLARLEAESKEAMFERRNNAKVVGGVADTKLLMPMMIQLVLIMLVIMVPALMAV